MASDLDEITERLDYCETEVAAIEAACAAYFADAFQERGKQMGVNLLVQVRVTKPLPTSIKSRIGTTIHEIRSCLDALACQLAARNNKAPTETYFPISKDLTTFEDDGLRKIKKLSKADRDAITALEPHGEARPFLFAMHKLDSLRKHRRLGLSVAKNSGIGIGNASINSLTIHGVPELDDQWKTAVTLGWDSWAQISFYPRVAFREPEELNSMEATDGIRRFLSEVREIVAKFL